jgi:hypothetical protein
MTTRNGFHDLMIIQTRQAEIADEFSVKALDESPFPGVIMTKGIVMDWLRASLIAQIVLGVWFQTLMWVPFLNSRPLAERSGIGAAPLSIVVIAGFAMLPPLLFTVACRRGSRSLIWICVVHYAGWLAVEMKSSLAGLSWPDAEHIVVQVLLWFVVVCSAVGLVKLEQQRGRPFPLWVFR